MIVDLALVRFDRLTIFLLSENSVLVQAHSIQKIFVVSCCHEPLFELLVSSPLKGLYPDGVNRGVYEVYVLITALQVSLL